MKCQVVMYRGGMTYEGVVTDLTEEEIHALSKDLSELASFSMGLKNGNTIVVPKGQMEHVYFIIQLVEERQVIE